MEPPVLTVPNAPVAAPPSRRLGTGRGAAGIRPGALLLLAAVLLLARAPGVGSETRRGTADFWSGPLGPAAVDGLVAAMSDEELLGQVFMIGYVGFRPSPELARWIRERNLGGVKIFSRNVDTLSGLAVSIRAMQEAAADTPLKIPLLVATDQEGGWVRHIKGETSTTPGNIALGAVGLPQDALLTGHYIGQELRALGVNMNFAPTIDVYSNPSASVIGPRAFSSDPLATAMLALAYYQGLSRSGVIATAKHFPGHGQADKDSHGTLPILGLTVDELWDRDLLPYRILIREGVPAIMTGHLAYPNIVGNMTPSSRSPMLVDGLLRDRMGFDGLVITDDMEMNGALSGGVTTAQASLEALRAGNDMILVSHSPRVQEQTWQLLRSSLAAEPQLRAKLETAVTRILTLKARTFREQGFPLFSEDTDPERFRPTREASEFFYQSALRSVTLVRERDIPFVPDQAERVLLVGQFDEFLQEGRRRYPRADTLRFSYGPFYWATGEDLERVHRTARRYDTVVFCLANYNSLQVLQTLRPLGRRLIVMSALSPVYLRETPWVTSALAVYGTTAESFRAGFAVLAGDYRPEGRLPVDFLGEISESLPPRPPAAGHDPGARR